MASHSTLLFVMTRINEARTNLDLSSPGAYNYLLQSNRNVGSFVGALQDFRNIKNDVDKMEELRRQYRKKFDVVWRGFSIFEINFQIQPEHQEQVTELITDNFAPALEQTICRVG